MGSNEMSDNGPTGNPVPHRPASSREILRMGLWNYASNRWLPKNPVLKFVVEIAVLVDPSRADPGRAKYHKNTVCVKSSCHP